MGISDREEWDPVFDSKSFSINDIEIVKLRRWLSKFFKGKMNGELDLWREKDFQLSERMMKILFDEGIINLYIVEGLRRQIKMS